MESNYLYNIEVSIDDFFAAVNNIKYFGYTASSPKCMHGLKDSYVSNLYVFSSDRLS